MEQAADLLMQAERPVIIAGRGVRWANASPQLIALAERLTVPVITTEMGRGSIPEDHPLAGGIVGHFGHSTANGLVREADLVLGLGSRFLNVNTINWSLISENAKIVQVENDPLEIGKQYAVTLGVHADSGAFLDDLLAHLDADGLQVEGRGGPPPRETGRGTRMPIRNAGTTTPTWTRCRSSRNGLRKPSNRSANRTRFTFSGQVCTPNGRTV